MTAGPGGGGDPGLPGTLHGLEVDLLHVGPTFVTVVPPARIPVLYFSQCSTVRLLA